MGQEAGTKNDDGKVRPSLIIQDFALALLEVAKVGTFGANKYTDHGWVQVPKAEKRYADAMFRHLLADATGEKEDPESGLSHKAHAAWNALATLELELRRQTHTER